MATVPDPFHVCQAENEPARVWLIEERPADCPPGPWTIIEAQSRDLGNRAIAESAAARHNRLFPSNVYRATQFVRVKETARR